MTIADINTLARFLTGTDTSSYTAANLLIAVISHTKELLVKYFLKQQEHDGNLATSITQHFPPIQ